MGELGEFPSSAELLDGRWKFPELTHLLVPLLALSGHAAEQALGEPVTHSEYDKSQIKKI